MKVLVAGANGYTGRLLIKFVAKTMIAAIQEPNAFHKAFEMVSGDTQIEEALKSL
ncbi:hypothetical protein GCM10007063_25090 [Lentibacillus kapialis]|uniref:Uncharacterized protein n=1 Tax=Lentibacillus kapialis TaxID=340214 RepID=A0A917PZM2_9BACI|nr:hypothetical protein [Lentibacillus kapialis]GGK01776.1 hypothetical protein GCM10007063_25090 [Lentibacillus kapialis]